MSRLTTTRTEGRRSIIPARHEAAHACVALVLNHHVNWSSVGKTKNGWLGLTSFRPKGNPDPFLYSLILLAGSCADEKLSKIPKWKYAHSDREILKGFGFSSFSINSMRHYSMALCDRLWCQIQDVAEELVEHDLTGEEIKKLVKIKPLRLK